MRKLKLFFACLLMAVLSIGQMWGAAISVTTNPTTSGTFTITAAKASGQNAPIEASGCVRLYANNTLTIETSGDANITGMTIAWTKNGSKAFATVTTGTGSYSHPSAAGSGTWTGSAKEIVFNVGSSGQIQITSVDITVEEGGGSSKENLTDEQLSWSAASANITFGDEPYSLPSLTNSIPVSVTYESTAEAVATISNVGVVSVLKAGSTTIKAVFAGNDDYNAKTVSYTLTVAPAPLTPIAGGIVDEIKISDLLTSGSGYQPFSDKQASNEGHSDAVYAGKVCISSTNIQMNTIGTNTSAGRSIVTTTSGGNAKRVQAFWGGTNTADRKLTVYGSNTAYAGTETAASGTKLGDLTYASGDSYAYIDITGDYAYLQIVASGAIYMSQINITWVAPDVSKVATPEISGTANFYPSTSVSISCSTDDAAIYYTTDGTAPTSASTLYEGAFTVNADGTTTVKAIAVKDGMTDSDVAERTFTKATVLTVASALSAASGANVYVTGTITSITEVSIQHKNATYVISDVTAGVPANEMIIYRGKYVDGADFDSEDQIHVGDVVVVSGTIGVYQEKNQLAQGNQIESITPAAVVAPVFSPNGGGFMGETDVTITCATGSSTIYYTLDGTTPTKSSTPYTAAIHLDATTTITAVAYVGDDASLVIAKTFTLTAPMTVTEALAALDTESPINNVAVAGIISTAPEYNPSSGKLTYYISDDGSASDELEVYKGFGVAGASFSDKADLQVGDEVTVFGNLTIYNTTKEFAEGSRLIAFNRPVVAVTGIDLTESTAEVEVGSTVTLHASVVPGNATDQGIVWSVTSGSDKASVDENGVVTGTAAGEAVIRAASHEDASIYEECTVTVTAVDPTKHVVTFDATLDYGDSPLVKGDITMTCTSGALNNQSEYRLYKSGTTTFECSVGNIIKIEFTGVSGNPVSGFGDPAVGTLVTEGNDGVWTGNAESVSFVASGAQVRATEIVVTYKEDNRAAAGLTWSTDAVELTVGDEFTAPTLNNPNSIAAGEITIASNNTDLATVTAGVVALVENATGEATITATFAGNEDYKPVIVSYTITVNEAGLDNVTFDATLDVAETGELSISKAGFTLEFTGGAMDNSENYRLYKGQTMTLSSTDYFIKKIEFTCTSGNPISGFADAEGLDKANNQWTGEANSVELTASNAQVRIEKMKVYYIEDTRAVSGLEWSTDEVEITLGDAFTPANLVNPNSIDASAITIESDNTDLAVVNDGVVSLVADATGTAHIKAIFAGNATYKPAKISYTIIVNDPTPTISVNKQNVNFASVEVGDAVPSAETVTVTLTNVASVTATLGGTNADAFSVSPASLTESGDITISILANTDAAASYSATLTISDGAEGAEDKTINLSFAVTEPVVEDDVTGTWTLVTNATTLAAGKKVIIAQYVEADGAINTMAGQASNNRSVIASTVAGATLTPTVGTKVMTLADAGEGNFYLKTSDGEYLYNASTSSKSYLRTKAEEENVSWTIAVDAEGVATITSVENTNRTKMRYNPNTSGSPLFNCYASGQEDIALYMLEEDTPDYGSYQRNVTNGNYGTICLPKAGVISGATLFEIADYANDMIYVDEITSGEMVAGRPYIFQATSTQLNVVYTSGTVENEAGHANGLYGFYNLENENAQFNIPVDNGNYILYSNQYWLVSGRAAYINNFRAYIKIGMINYVAPAPGIRRVAMQVNGQSTTTGVDQITNDQSPITNKVIIDGRLFILRGEKMYNANGQLVK